MKQFYLLLILIFSSLFLFSQKFTIKELESLNKSNWDDFDTYVTSKGYQFFEAISTNFSEKRSYAFNQDVSNNKALYFIAFYKYPINDPLFVSSVDFQTLTQKEYLNLKIQAKQEGYKFIKSNIEGNSTFFIYKKGKREISFVVTKKDNSLPSYVISVTFLK